MIVAVRGEEQFLLEDGRIIDLEQRKVFNTGASVETILRRGYWKPYTGSQDREWELLDGLTAK